MLNKYDIDEIRMSGYERIVEICKEDYSRVERKKNAFDEIKAVVGFVESTIEKINAREEN